MLKYIFTTPCALGIFIFSHKFPSREQRKYELTGKMFYLKKMAKYHQKPNMLLF